RRPRPVRRRHRGPESAARPHAGSPGAAGAPTPRRTGPARRRHRVLRPGLRPRRRAPGQLRPRAVAAVDRDGEAALTRARRHGVAASRPRRPARRAHGAEALRLSVAVMTAIASRLRACSARTLSEPLAYGLSAAI